jgi:hypothetical protein
MPEWSILLRRLRIVSDDVAVDYVELALHTFSVDRKVIGLVYYATPTPLYYLRTDNLTKLEKSLLLSQLPKGRDHAKEAFLFLSIEGNLDSSVAITTQGQEFYWPILACLETTGPRILSMRILDVKGVPTISRVVGSLSTLQTSALNAGLSLNSKL